MKIITGRTRAYRFHMKTCDGFGTIDNTGVQRLNPTGLAALLRRNAQRGQRWNPSLQTAQEYAQERLASLREFA